MSVKSYYPRADRLPGFATEQLTLDQTIDFSRELIQLTGEAYAAEATNPDNNTLDAKGKPLRASSILAHYDPDNPLVRERFALRTRGIHDRGGRITIVQDAVNPSEILGYCKIGPAANMTEREDGLEGMYDYNGFYINNIVTHPRHFGQGIGNIALYAALLSADVQPTDPLVLDAMHGNNRANLWYLRLNFKPQPDVPTDPLTFGEQAIPQQYYYAETSAKTMQHLTHRIGVGA